MTATTSVQVADGLAPNPVLERGSGSPVVFLHGPFGQEWPAYLDDLAAHHRVLAPASPGIADAADLTRFDGFWELVLYYDDLFDQLGLGEVDLIGHSFGAMVAAEIAATHRSRVRRLVLIDAMGLWNDATPVQDHLLVSEQRRGELLYHDHTVPEISQRLVAPHDLTQARAATLALFDALGATSHFIHPIPERGLRRRLRRVRAKTLLLWGETDRLVPPSYADEFAAEIPDATVELIPQAGHYPYLEQREAVTAATLRFLADPSLPTERGPR